MNWRSVKLLWAFVLLAGLPGVGVCQTGLDAGQLPKSTLFYFAWHGTPPSDARKANSLLALWDDAEFAPIRGAMIDSIVKDSHSTTTPEKQISSEELTALASLLDNEFLVGYLSDPAPVRGASVSASGMVHHWQGAFLVYDRTGKEATLAKLVVRLQSSEKNLPKISTVTIAGIPVMKIVRVSGTSYWAEDGKYAYSASEPAVLEQIVGWTKHTSVEANSLAKIPAYQESSSTLHGGIAEFFVRFPGVKDLPADVSPGGFRLGPLLQSLRIDAIHAVAGKLTLDGARTRMQGAILGDAKPGTPFDIWADAVAEPASLRFVNENTVSYQSSQVNLLGIYGLIKRALKPAGEGKQAGTADLIEQSAETRLGMSLADALGAFSGEFASVQPSAAFDPERQVFFAGIRKKPEALKLLRAGLEERLSGERNEGDITFFKVSEGGMQSAAGTAAWKYYHVAVAPDGILVAAKSDALREALAVRKNQASASKQLPQVFQTARSQFPPNIDGLSFIDFQKFDWTAMKNRWNAADSKGAAKAGTRTAPKTATPPGALENAMKDLDPGVLRRHLHLTTSASWKDAQGMHFDGWIE